LEHAYISHVARDDLHYHNNGHFRRRCEDNTAKSWPALHGLRQFNSRGAHCTTALEGLGYVEISQVFRSVLLSMCHHSIQNWLQSGREKKEDIDETTIDGRPLTLTLTPSQIYESGVSSNMLIIFLSTGIFSFPHFFFVMGCEPEGMLSL